MHAHGAGSVIHTKMAWDALREALGYCIDEGCPHCDTTHTCINPIAEQSEQEPVAYRVTAGRRISDGAQVVFGDNEILYTAPVQQFFIPYEEDK